MAHKVKPTFEQFRADLYTLSEDDQWDTEIDDFKDHVLECRAIGSRLKKYGYQMGPKEDDSYFYTWVKQLENLDVDVVIQFSGCQHFMQDEKVALRNLHFTKHYRTEVYHGRKVKLPLARVPPVLLSEAYSQFKEVAKNTDLDPGFEGMDVW